jgi:hypothetical protein
MTTIDRMVAEAREKLARSIGTKAGIWQAKSRQREQAWERSKQAAIEALDAMQKEEAKG